MGVIMQEPRHAVSDATPGFNTTAPCVPNPPRGRRAVTVRNFTGTDYAKWATLAGGSAAFGHFCAHKALQRPSAAAGLVLGVTSGFLWAYQSSAGRLMGFFPPEKDMGQPSS